MMWDYEQLLLHLHGSKHLYCRDHLEKEERIMAKPIKETPVLYDEDAYRFEMAAHNVVPLSEEERAERLAAYEKISKKVSFALWVTRFVSFSRKLTS